MNLFRVAKLHRIVSAASFFLSDDDVDLLILTYFLSNLGHHIPKLGFFFLWKNCKSS